MEKLELAEEKREMQEGLSSRVEAAEEQVRQMEAKMQGMGKGYREQLEQANKTAESLQSRIDQLSETLRQKDTSLQQLDRSHKDSLKHLEQSQA